MAKYEEHSLIREARQRLDIEGDDFTGAYAETFVKRSPAGRKADLALLDAELSNVVSGANEMRQQMQVHRLRSHLAGLDERLKRGGL